MGTPKRVFTTSIKDDIGWPFEKAFVVLWQASASVQTGYDSPSDDCESDYREILEAGIIAFKANWWGNREMQLADLPSRPIRAESFSPAEVIYEKDSNGEFIDDGRGNKISTGNSTAGEWGISETLIVDVEHEESKIIAADPLLTSTQKVFDMMEAHVKRITK